MKRRWLKRLLWGLLALLLLLLLVVAGGYLYLTSGAGGARIRDEVLGMANEQFKGKLAADKVDVSARKLVLEGLKLYDPEGVLVAEIARVEVDLNPTDLLGDEIAVSAAKVSTPRLYLKKDARGLNLLRALEAKKLRPSDLTGTKGPEKKFALRLDTFELTDGYVDFVEEIDDPDVEDRHIRATGLGATGKVFFATGPSSAKATLSLKGGLELPTSGPIALEVRYDDDGKKKSGEVSLDVASVVAQLSGTLEGTERADVELQKLSVDPTTAKAFLPAYPLRVPVEYTGKLQQRGNVLSADTVLKAGQRAVVTLKGGFDIARFRAQAVDLTAKDINLEELLHDGPKSDFSLHLTADGGGSNLSNLDARVTLDVPESSLSRQRIGPIKLRADAKDGKFHVPELAIVLPGANVHATGEGNLETLDFKGELNAADLSRLARTVGEMTPQEALPLAGNGKLRFHVKGPPKHPSLQLDGDFASLRYDDYSLTGLSLNATLADVTRPLEADGSLRAKRIAVGTNAFDDLAADIHTRGRQLSADVTAQGLTSLLIHAGGTLDEDSEGLLLDDLRLQYPEATWTLQAPSHLRWPEEGVTVPTLTLKSDAQRLTAALTLSQGRLDASVNAEELDLARLPAALVDKSWNLGGRVHLDVKAKGRLPRPNVVAKLDLAGAQFQELKDAKLSLDGSYERDRLVGSLTASAEAGSVDGRFDVPVMALLKKRHEPLTVTVDIPRLELQRAIAAAGRTDPVQGVLQSSLNVTGFTDDPKVLLTVKGEDVRYGEYPPKEQTGARFQLDVTPAEGTGALNARLDVEGFKSHALLTLATPLTLGRLRERPPDLEALMSTPVELMVNADRIDIASLDPTGKGSATLTVDARGTAHAPIAKMKLTLNGVQRGAMKPLDGSVFLDATESRVLLSSVVTHAGEALLNLTANAEAPLRELLLEERREKVPLKIDARVAPVTLATLRALTGSAADEEEELQGTLSAQLKASGTLSEPRIQLDGSLEKLGISAQALGRVGITWVYGASNHTGVVVLSSPSGGSCDIRARSRLDISAPALRRPIEWEKAPIEGSLDARGFNLQFLSGIHPKLRAIGGTLDATGSAKGTVGAPEWTGAAEWKDGRLALMGYGDYRKVHLKALASNQRYFLEDLTASSGGGKMQLTADAVKTGAAYALTMKATMDKFPLIYDDQLFAVATLNTTARGEATSALVNIAELAIPEAHLELPQIKRKDLQDLDRPDDIVLMRDGQIIDKKQAKRRAERLAAEEARKRGQTGGAVVADQSAKAEASTEYRITINAPRNLWVRGADVNAELGLSQEFRIEYKEALQLFGSVNIRQGSADVIGRRFTAAKDSQVRFQGPAGQPFINMTAIYVNEREQVTVFMVVRMDNNGFSLKPTSQPPLAEAEIWTLLATGRRQLKRGSGSSMTGAEAATIVSSAIASELRKTLPSKVPLDVLSIEGGEEGLAGSKLEAGTYVTDKIYVGYTGRIGANAQEGENSHAVRFEYQISPRWSFESSYGDANAGGADIVWTRDY